MPPDPAPSVPRFAEATLVVIWRRLERELARRAAPVEIEVPDPDRGAGAGVGARLRDARGAFVQRPLRVWCDLAERLGCRLATPRAAPKAAPDDAGGFVRLRFEPLEPADLSAPPAERYAPGSDFARLDKLEDADGLISLVEAYERIGVGAGMRVLVLGAASGREIAALELPHGAPPLTALSVTAVDHAPGAIRALEARFGGSGSVRAIAGDINDLDALLAPEARFDMAVAVGLLQSPGVDRDALLRALVKRRLAPEGALLLGLPNSRLRRGDQLWGARSRNVGPVELGLLLRDAAAIRRYLQQQRFRVFASGKYELLLTAVRRG